MRASEKKQNLPTADAIKVLIADDDPPTRILLRAAITQWGYEVVEASNGEEAWQLLQQADPPRLLILDWLMPKLDGISLCERIKREQTLHPYTILLTQVTGTTNIIKGLEAGADEFLSKPFNMAELRSRLSVGSRIIRFENTLAEQNKKVQNYASQMEILSQAHAQQLVYHSDLLGLLASLIETISQEIYNLFAKNPPDNQAQPSPEWGKHLQQIEALRHQFASVIAIVKRLQINSVYVPKSRACQLNDLIQNTLTISQSATRPIQVTVELAHSLPPLSADPEQLQELFLGLILSAAQALKNQDHPVLRLETKLSSNKQAIQIILEDSGPSLSEKELEIMMQPHWIANELEQIHSRFSIVTSKDIIKKYGGSLLIENLAGRGIRLTINMPLQVKLS